MPVAMVNWAWKAISLPWSQVTVRNSSSGSVPMACLMAGLDTRCAAACGQVQQQDVAGGALNQGADRGLAVLADDQVAFRKTERGPGGPGVAEVALRSGRLL